MAARRRRGNDAERSALGNCVTALGDAWAELAGDRRQTDEYFVSSLRLRHFDATPQPCDRDARVPRTRALTRQVWLLPSLLCATPVRRCGPDRKRAVTDADLPERSLLTRLGRGLDLSLLIQVRVLEGGPDVGVPQPYYLRHLGAHRAPAPLVWHDGQPLREGARARACLRSARSRTPVLTPRRALTARPRHVAQVANLAAFFLLTIFPQLFTHLELLIAPTLLLPFEAISGSVMLVMLSVEAYVSYYATRKLIHKSTAQFHLQHDADADGGADRQAEL
jgi:hypothetical protein